MTSSLSPTLRAEQRAQQHWVEDGLPSIAAGVGGLVLAFFMLYQKNGHSPFKIVLLLSALTLYWAISQHQTEIVDWLKTRLSYPRTGYLRPPYMPEDKSLPLDFKMLSMQGVDTTQPEEIKRARARSMWRFLTSLSLILAAFVIIAYFHSPWIDSPWLYFAVSLSLVAMLRVLALIEHRRLSWIVLTGFLLVGFSMSFLQREGIVGPNQFGYFLIGISLVTILSGAISLIRFLLRNPRPPAATP